MRKYLAIDPGGKRSGLATGDDLTMQVGPVGVITTADRDELVRQIVAAIQEHDPDELVVGVPYHMDGSDSVGSHSSMQLVEQLRETTGLIVHPVDERLTSFAADELMSQSGLTHKQKKARRDALAAAAILRDFLQNKSRDERAI